MDAAKEKSGSGLIKIVVVVAALMLGLPCLAAGLIGAITMLGTSLADDFEQVSSQMPEEP